MYLACLTGILRKVYSVAMNADQILYLGTTWHSILQVCKYARLHQMYTNSYLFLGCGFTAFMLLKSFNGENMRIKVTEW